MMLEPQVSKFDPDFDRPSAPRSQRGDASRSFKKRLVVNPFLVLVDWVVAFALLRAAIARVNSVLFLIGAALLLLGFLLLQYHCLDCGRTGWLIRQGRHICPDDVFRRPGRQPRRLRVPGIGVQIMVWCYLLATVIILSLILARA